MRNRRYGNRDALEVRVDYVETKLDETVNSFKEALNRLETKLDENVRSLKESFKETIDKLEVRIETDRLASEKRLEIDRLASEKRLEIERIAAESRLADERRESRSIRRQMTATLIGVGVSIVASIALATVLIVINLG